MNGQVIGQKQSGLRIILNKVYEANSKEDALQIISDYLKDPVCIIRQSQRRTMLIYATRCNTLTSLQSYVTNSFLYYEFGPVNRFNQNRF
jgi:hypothetical protein